MVIIATFNDMATAKRIRERLQQAGIKADINSEGHLQTVASRADAKANIKLSVAEDDFAKTQELLVAWEKSDPDLQAAVHCPQCNSSRIHYPQLARRFPLIPGIAGVLLALKIFPKEFYCEDCHFTWTDQLDRPIGKLWHKAFPGEPAERS